MKPRMRALFVALAAALVLVRAAGADEAADADKRFREAFKPIKLPPAAKIEKDVTPTLPQGIVTESGPFDAVVKTLVAPYEKQLAERDDAMAKIGAAADPVADVVLASGVLDAENADLAAKIEKDVTPTLPQGIVTESGPFDAVVKTLVAPYEAQLASRDDAMAKIGAAADPVADVVLASGVLDAEDADLAARVAAVEAMYSEVWDADFMASGEKVHRARKLAAVLIPFYRTLSARNEAVAAAAAEALAKGGDAARTAKLVLAATKDPSPAVRGTAALALGRLGGADALAALTKVRASDASPLVRTKALAALCRFKTSEMKDAAVAALADAAWEVRALAAAVCVRAKIVDACGALVVGIEKEDGRLRKDFDDALQALMAVRFYGDVALAKKWWAEHQADVAEKSKALAAAGEYEKPVGPVETWDGTDADAEGADKAKGVTASFFGIATPSRRILFVFDVSFSMKDAAGARPAAPTGVSKDAYPAPAGDSKMDVARWQLHRAIAALPKDAAFDIVFFSESYKLWQEQMAEATDKTKAKAHEFIDAIKPNGTTNICDSLDKVFEIAGAAPAAARGKTPDLGADTVYLMTDGNPNRGRIVDETKLLDSLVAKNHSARLVIHTIGIGEAAGSALLQSLAKRTGGQYVGFK